MNRSTSPATSPAAPRPASRLRLGLLLVAILATSGVVLTWLGCTYRRTPPTPTQAASAALPSVGEWPDEPEQDPTSEPPIAPAPLSPHGRGAGGEGAAPPTQPPPADVAGSTSLGPSAFAASSSRTLAEVLGLAADPPMFADAPRLPSPEDFSGAGAAGAAVADAALAALGGGGPRRRPDEQIAAIETQVFGLTGRGSQFVFVFDRSASMEGPPLAAAKRELLASLRRLDRIHQFQILFYNENPKLMRLAADQPPAMVFADENGLRSAATFVSNITASGGTDHLQALKLALRMNPDVIFFLTDADDPVLTDAELAEIRRANGGVAIHAIEFCPGPAPAGGSALRKLAADNRGQYQYVDVTQLPK